MKNTRFWSSYITTGSMKRIVARWAICGTSVSLLSVKPKPAISARSVWFLNFKHNFRDMLSTVSKPELFPSPIWCGTDRLLVKCVQQTDGHNWVGLVQSVLHRIIETNQGNVKSDPNRVIHKSNPDG